MTRSSATAGKQSKGAAKGGEDPAPEEAGKKSSSESKPQDAAAETKRLLDAFRGDRSVLDLQEYVKIPRVRIVQEQTPSRPWGEGSLFTQPAGVLLCGPDESIELVPLFFYPKWIAWNDRDDTSRHPIHAQSVDPASIIARKSRHHNDRVERYGADGAPDRDGHYTREYVEHLVIVGVIRTGSHAGERVSVEFARGDYQRGRDLLGEFSKVAVAGRQAPYWSQVWCVGTERVTRSDESCFALRWELADLVSPDEAEVLREQYEMLKEQHRRRQLETAED